MHSTKIKIDDEEVEITKEMIERYKIDTRKTRATKKGIEKFFNALFNQFNKLFIF